MQKTFEEPRSATARLNNNNTNETVQDLTEMTEFKRPSDYRRIYELLKNEKYATLFENSGAEMGAPVRSDVIGEVKSFTNYLDR